MKRDWNPIQDRVVFTPHELVEPSAISEIRSRLACEIGGASERFDRRGFRLLQWPSPHSRLKPIELSLEHEARLKPVSPKSLARLLAALAVSDGRTMKTSELCPGDDFASLVVNRVHRMPGSQSLDEYFDVASSPVSYVESGYTLRRRVKGRDFMTWSESSADGVAYNIELPCVRLASTGVIARLEFNWIAGKELPAAETIRPAADSLPVEPIPIVNHLTGFDLFKATACSLNETVREKFTVSEPGDGLGPRFVINVDFISVTSCGAHARRCHFVDVDISSLRRTDVAEVDALVQLSRRLAERYDLSVNSETKSSRALVELATIGWTPA